MAIVNESFTAPSWPIEDNHHHHSIVKWLVVLLFTLLIIVMIVECCCVPMCFCARYSLYSQSWYPYYYSQKQIPTLYRHSCRLFGTLKSMHTSSGSGDGTSVIAVSPNYVCLKQRQQQQQQLQCSPCLLTSTKVSYSLPPQSSPL